MAASDMEPVPTSTVVQDHLATAIRLLENASGFHTEDLAIAIDLFVEDSGTAKAFIAIQNSSTRLYWIQRKIAVHHGAAPPYIQEGPVAN